MLCKNNESGMRECDKFWKEKSEIQSTWDKKYILKYKPDNSIYTSIMKFRYIEDYKKMKKLDEMLYRIVYRMNNNNQPFYDYDKQLDFICELKEETRKLEKFVKNCNFLNIDYDDGEVFLHKFWNINTFLANGKHIKIIFAKLLRVLENSEEDGFPEFLYVMLKKGICPSLKKIYDELIQRGILDLE